MCASLCDYLSTSGVSIGFGAGSEDSKVAKTANKAKQFAVHSELSKLVFPFDLV